MSNIDGRIGILRAIGMFRGHIALLFLGEAIIAGAVGGSLGAVFGSGLAQWLVGLERETVSELYGIKTIGRTAIHLARAVGRMPIGNGAVRDRGVGPMPGGEPGPPRLWPSRPGNMKPRVTIMADGPSWPWGYWVWPGFSPCPVRSTAFPVFGYAAGFCGLTGVHAARTFKYSSAEPGGDGFLQNVFGVDGATLPWIRLPDLRGETASRCRLLW